MTCYFNFCTFGSPHGPDAVPDPDALYLWRLRDIDPLSTYVRVGVALIGDAAHAQLPWTGLEPWS